jgi:hypothetical protein
VSIFVSVLEGDNAASATPVLATSDERIVRAVAHAIADCLGFDAVPPRTLVMRRTGAAKAAAETEP